MYAIVTKKWILALSLAFSCQLVFAVIDMSTGNYSDNWVDLNGEKLVAELVFERTYNSRSRYSGIFGFGWCSDWETKLAVNPDNSIRITECGGGMEVDYHARDLSKEISETVNNIVKEIKARNAHLEWLELKQKITVEELGKAATVDEYWEQFKRELEQETILRDEFARQLHMIGNTHIGRYYLRSGRPDEWIRREVSGYTRSLPKGGYEQFDFKGRLVKMYRGGSDITLELVYEGDLLKSVNASNGQSIGFVHTGDTKQLKEIHTPNGGKAQYRFDQGNLTWIKNEYGLKYTYAYDEEGNLTRIGFPNGRYKEITYDTDNDWVIGFRDTRECIEEYKYENAEQVPLSNYKVELTKRCKDEVTNKSTAEFFMVPREGGEGRRLARSIWTEHTPRDGNVRRIERHYAPTTGRVVLEVEGDRVTEYRYDIKARKRAVLTDEEDSLFEYRNVCGKPSSLLKKIRSKNNGHNKSNRTQFIYRRLDCRLTEAYASNGKYYRIEYEDDGRIKGITTNKNKLYINYNRSKSEVGGYTVPSIGTIQVKSYDHQILEEVASINGMDAGKKIRGVMNYMRDDLEPVLGVIPIFDESALKK